MKNKKIYTFLMLFLLFIFCISTKSHASNNEQNEKIDEAKIDNIIIYITGGERKKEYMNYLMVVEFLML